MNKKSWSVFWAIIFVFQAVHLPILLTKNFNAFLFNYIRGKTVSLFLFTVSYYVCVWERYFIILDIMLFLNILFVRHLNFISLFITFNITPVLILYVLFTFHIISIYFDEIVLWMGLLLLVVEAEVGVLHMKLFGKVEVYILFWRFIDY